MERILVTGGAGFIGSHTVDRLLKEGRQVIVLDNLSSGKTTNLNLQHPALEFLEGDVLEYPLLEGLVSSCDAVVHLAALSSVQFSVENPIYSFQVNTQGFLHVLQAIRQARRKIRLVYASSAAVYGNTDQLPCRDDQPLADLPISPYALQKLHNEQYAAVYEKLYGVQSLGLRYFNVYGSRQDPASPYSGVISRFLSAYQNDTDLTVLGDGRQSRDFIYVDDIVTANWRALNAEVTGVLNVATEHPETLLQLIDYMSQAGHRPAKIQFGPERVGDIKSSYGSTRKAEKELEFRYSVPLKEGMKCMLELPK